MRRNFKLRHNLANGLVQDHHVIPLGLRGHTVPIKLCYDFNASDNIVMMPTPLGLKYMNVRKHRLVHFGGHKQYNIYVETWLDHINKINNHEYMKREFYNFRDFLKRNCRDNIDYIPWK